jgi:excisionase family DNA binding protein
MVYVFAMSPKIYTTGQAAAAAGISRQTLYTWIAEGKVKMPATKIGNTGVWSESQVNELKRVKRPKLGRRPKKSKKVGAR